MAVEPPTGTGRGAVIRRSGRPWWHHGILLFAVILVVQTLSPSVSIGDSRLSTVTAWSLLTHGNFDLERYRVVTSLSNKYDVVTNHGHVLPFFPWPTMLLALPGDIIAWLVGKNPANLSIANPNRTFIIELPTASAVAALTALALRAAVLRIHTGTRAFTSTTATVVALLFAFTTSAWSVGSRALWQQTASMLWLSLLLLGLVKVEKGERWLGRLGLVAGLAVICRPTDIVVVGAVLTWLAYRYRTRAAPALGGAASVLVAFFLVSRLAYGEWLPPYYSFGRFSGTVAVPFIDGLFYNLVSPSRGLLFYDPIVLLAVAGMVMAIRKRSLTPAMVLAALAVPAQLLLIADYGSDGGTVYGPRLMVDIVPMLAFLSAPVIQYAFGQPRQKGVHRPGIEILSAVVVVTVSAFGLFVNATGAVLRSSRCWNTEPVSIDTKPSRAWDWSDPQFLWPYRQLVDGGTLHDVEKPVCTSS